MQFRTLGSSDLKVSAFSYGTWQLGDKAYWGDSNWESDKASVFAALDSGINMFDTAAAYGKGESEIALGKALGNKRDDILIASKVLPEFCEPTLLRKQCEDSLMRLKTDRIDLYQIHWPFYHVTNEEVWSVLEELVKEGKVREIGLSNYGSENQDEWFDGGTAVSNQLGYNLLTRTIEDEVLPACEKHGLGVMVYMPLMQGILTGRWDNVDDIPASRRRTRHFSDERDSTRHGEPGCESELMKALGEIERISEGLGITMADLSLAWVLANPAVTTVIVGGRKREQIERNLRALDIELSPETVAELNDVTAPVKKALGTRIDMFCGETECRSK